jgi:hypothetical protein
MSKNAIVVKEVGSMQVRSAVRVFCTALHRDRRFHAACASQPFGPRDPVSLALAGVAKRGAWGNFHDPDEFMEDMRRSVVALLQPTEADRWAFHLTSQVCMALLGQEQFSRIYVRHTGDIRVNVCCDTLGPGGLQFFEVHSSNPGRGS